MENEGALRMRRALLMDGLAASLRLPETPVVAPPTPGSAAAGLAGEVGDGVFLRLMALTKGRKLLARALRVVYPAPEAQPSRHSALVAAGEELPAAPLRPNLRVVWAALRSLRRLFCGQPGGAEDVAASAAVAAALAELLRRLHSPQAVADCLAAVVAGDLDGAPLLDTQPDTVLMPLYVPGAPPARTACSRAAPASVRRVRRAGGSLPAKRPASMRKAACPMLPAGLPTLPPVAASAGANAHDAQRPWLADVLMALLQRAAELDLLPSTVPDEGVSPAAAAWRGTLPRLHALVERHVSALHEAFQAGMAMGEREAAAQVKALMPISLVRVLLPHCSQEQAGALRGMLRDLGV